MGLNVCVAMKSARHPLKIGSWRLAPVEGELRFSTTAVIATLQSGPSIKGKLTVDLELYSI
jgi:hypothetical protein